ncbi:MAG TPA: TetR/AcrR family transcriptional regulator [Actinomycetota bacterium]|nr:TetR/AcrR family transcriptional regulator [Actinomycetota bacterium]
MSTAAQPGTAARRRPGAPRRRRAPKGQGDRLREEIVDAAEALLLSTGNQDAVSIRAVADAVGVSPPALYLHFADKTELILAVCQRHLAHLDRVLDEAAAGIDDPLESLRRRGRAYVGFGVDNPEIYRILFMMRPTSSPPDWLHARMLESPSFVHWIGIVQAALARGAVRPAPTHVVALGLWSAVHGLTSLCIAKPDLFEADRDTLVGYLLDVLITGIATP